MAFSISLRSVDVNSIFTAAVVLIQALEFARAGNGHDPGFLRQQPGQRDLRRGGAFFCSDLFKQINHGPVGFDRLWRKARIAAADIGAVEGRVLVDLAGQVTAAQRTVGHKPNAKFLAGRQDLSFDGSPPDRIFALQGRDGLNRMGAADLVCVGFGQAQNA